MNMEVLEYLMQARPIKKLNVELQTLYESLANTNSNQNEIFNKIEKVFNKYNVSFISMRKNFDTSSLFRKTMIGMLSIFAQLK